MPEIPESITAGPDWIGDVCKECEFGVMNADELTRTDFLYIDRAQQFKRGEIKFCDCIAGISYRAFLERSADDIIKESNKAPTVRWAGPDGKQTMGTD